MDKTAETQVTEYLTFKEGRCTMRKVLGEFPSGQRGQTVNLLAMPSVVRIHLPPLGYNRESVHIFKRLRKKQVALLKV